MELTDSPLLQEFDPFKKCIYYVDNPNGILFEQKVDRYSCQCNS